MKKAWDLWLRGGRKISAAGRYLQPMEFLLRRGIVFGSMYASGPIGRMGVRQAIAFIKYRESRKRRD